MTELQKEILGIFKEIKQVCERNKLRYFAVFGTCIGAARHQGFIPWDDDLDIAMPDVDYEKFYAIAQRELPSNLKVFYTYDKRNNLCLFMKVHNINTAFIEEYERPYPDSYKGVFVDIFPISGLPAQKRDKKRFLEKVDWAIKLNARRRQSFRSLMSIKSKIIWIFAHLFPVDFWSNRWKALICAYRFDESQEVGLLATIINEKNIYEKSYFESYASLQFEDIEIRCPCNWDMYLSKRYGNYMIIPPVSEQENHMDGSIIDLDRSYLIYRNNEEKSSL